MHKYSRLTHHSFTLLSVLIRSQYFVLHFDLFLVTLSGLPDSFVDYPQSRENWYVLRH